MFYLVLVITRLCAKEGCALCVTLVQTWAWERAGNASLNSEPHCCEAVMLALLHQRTLESLILPKSDVSQTPDHCGIQVANRLEVCYSVCAGDLDTLLKQQESINTGKPWL